MSRGFPGYAESGEIPTYGQNSILPKEHGGKFFNLPIIRYLDDAEGVGAIASWDSSVHDSLCLNKVTPSKSAYFGSCHRSVFEYFFWFVDNERAYMIIKMVVRLSHPTAMDLVLRKRVCFNVYKRWG